jgi:hypothetical protein
MYARADFLKRAIIMTAAIFRSATAPVGAFRKRSPRTANPPQRHRGHRERDEARSEQQEWKKLLILASRSHFASGFLLFSVPSVSLWWNSSLFLTGLCPASAVNGCRISGATVYDLE